MLPYPYQIVPIYIHSEVLNIFNVWESTYREENAKHLFAYLMGEGACQLDILDRASWGRQLTSETIPTSIGGL